MSMWTSAARRRPPPPPPVHVTELIRRHAAGRCWQIVTGSCRYLASSSPPPTPSQSADVKVPTHTALKSWESGARRVQNVNGENNTYMDHIRDLHDPSLHLKTIEDELKGTIGKALRRQADKILTSVRCMEQEHKRLIELMERHGATTHNGNSTSRNDEDDHDDDDDVCVFIDDHPDVTQCAEKYNEYRKEAIQRRWELIVHRQAVGFIVENHKVVMETFPIPPAIKIIDGERTTTKRKSPWQQQQQQKETQKKTVGDQLEWWQKIGRWK